MATEPSGPKGTGDPHSDVAGALHDVSNALTVILGWVIEARVAGGGDSAMAQALGVIETQARIARNLARRAIGAEPAATERSDSLDAVLGEALDALKVEAQRAGVAVVREGSAGGVRVAAAGDVLQIVTNLLLNALAHTPEGSRVRVDVVLSSQSASIDVCDEGSGVPPELRGRVFDGGSGRVGGAGLGLRHSRALARAAGGELSLVDGDGGARFHLVWPRADVAAAPRPSMPSPPLLQGKRVLVVEDDRHVTLLLETALGARGAIITVAHDAKELAKALEAGAYDAALIDLSPIAADVEGAITELRKGSPGVTLVFISGSAVGLPPALAGQDVRWVRKPFEVGELVEAVMASRTK